MLIYRGLFLGVGIIDLLLAAKSFTRKKRCGKSMAYTLFFAMLTTIAYLFSICTESYLLSSVFSSIYFACIDWILIWLLIFVIDFTRPRRKRFMTKTLLRLMIGYAVVDAVAFMLNPWLEFVASYREMLVMGFTVYKFIPHLWFNLHLGFCYILIGISIGYLVEKTVQVPKVYRSRYLVVVGSVLSVVAMNLLYLAALAVFVNYARTVRKQFGGLSGDLAGWFLQRAEFWMLAALVLCQYGEKLL